MTLLIALTSPAPAMGKSTVAERLIKAHGFHLLKFAAPLKDMIRIMLQRHCGIHEAMVERYVEGDLKEVVIPELGVTGRHLMVTLGTEWGRDQVRPDLWVHLVCQAVTRWRSLGRNVVIDDLRFVNEFEMVQALGGEPVRVVRPGVIKPSGHHSEGALDGHCMRSIHNRGTIDDLHLDVDRLVSALSAA